METPLNDKEANVGLSDSNAGLGDEKHWADGAPETLAFVRGKFFHANMEDESRAVLDKLAEFERQRNAARDACRLALNAFERGDCIDWDIVAEQASHNVQIEGQPAFGLSRSNAGLGIIETKR